MELGLSLGASSKALTLMEKKPSPSSELQANNDLNTTLSIGPIFSTSNNKTSEEEEGDQDQDQEDEDEESKRQKDNILSCVNSLSSSSSHLHDLLPHHSSKPLPLSSFSWHPPSDHNCKYSYPIISPFLFLVKAGIFLLKTIMFKKQSDTKYGHLF